MYRVGRNVFSVCSLKTTVVTGLMAVALGGCSAEVLRFDAPVLGYKNPAGGPAPERLPPDNSLYSQRPPVSPGSEPRYEPPPTVTGNITRSELPPAQTPPRAQPPRQRYAAARPEAAPRAPAPREQGSERVTVQPGDTLYGLARRHGVTVADIKAANGLTTNVIKPGQTLTLERGAYRLPTTRAEAPPRTTPTPPPITSADAATYRVQPGDSLYAISRRTGVRIAALKEMNGIADARKLRPGTVLRLRETITNVPAFSPRAPIARTSPTTVEPRRFEPSPRLEPRRTARVAETRTRIQETQEPGYNPSSATTPRILNPNPRTAPPTNRARTPLPGATRQPEPEPERRTAALDRAPEPSTNTPAAANGKFRWPVRGRIVRGFGKREDGSKNDGIDIAVPIGTEVHAAEEGVVAYAGDELPGYGKLVLIRHENGWVSAYAHADALLVKRGDSVRRGQVIARAGKTGNVRQPMLHFELRKGAKPVNPLPHLDQG